ncbi:MAG TPA: condensation domain-containing protein, partial [Candidatus Polarisedimenticolia bacterium]|nr:condensation domain-containing protein [Candidatus Polarisedimenticolia bacterium]
MNEEARGHSMIDRDGTLARLRERAAQAARSEAIPRRAGHGPAPASFAQERLWFLEQLAPGDIAYNLATPLHLVGDLNLPALERSLSEIISRHEALRTSFQASKGAPAQVVAPPEPVQLFLTDLEHRPAGKRLRLAMDRAREEAARPFAL